MLPYTAQPLRQSLGLPSTQVFFAGQGMTHTVGATLQPPMCILLQHSWPLRNTWACGKKVVPWP